MMRAFIVIYGENSLLADYRSFTKHLYKGQKYMLLIYSTLHSGLTLLTLKKAEDIDSLFLRKVTARMG